MLDTTTPETSASSSLNKESQAGLFVRSVLALTVLNVMLTILQWNYSSKRESQNVVRASLKEQLSGDQNHISLIAWNFARFAVLYLSFHKFSDSAENIHLEELKQ